MSDSLTTNPYAVTTDALALPGMGNDFEAIRKKYISHEASVKSIGTLYMLGGIIGLLLTVGYVFAAASASTRGGDAAGSAAILIVLAAISGGMAVFQIVVARGLWQLLPWARIAATVLSCIGLLGVPLGTIISAYFLYLLQSEKGTMVFSDQYKEVIRATPHIKYRTSLIVWILLGALIALILVGVIAAIFGGAR